MSIELRDKSTIDRIRARFDGDVERFASSRQAAACGSPIWRLTNPLAFRN
jgi:hypothetical protein